MRRYNKTENGSEIVEISDEDLQGKEVLRRYLRDRQGRQATVSQLTGISTPALSKMANMPEYRLSFEAAVLIELATEGELRTEQLCPSRAAVLNDLLRMRATQH